MNSLLSYFPEKVKPQPTVLVQARIPKNLHAEAQKLIRNRKLNWNECFVGLLRAFLDDVDGSDSETVITKKLISAKRNKKH